MAEQIMIHAKKSFESAIKTTDNVYAALSRYIDAFNSYVTLIYQYKMTIYYENAAYCGYKIIHLIKIVKQNPFNPAHVELPKDIFKTKYFLEKSIELHNSEISKLIYCDYIEHYFSYRDNTLDEQEIKTLLMICKEKSDEKAIVKALSLLATHYLKEKDYTYAESYALKLIKNGSSNGIDILKDMYSKSVIIHKLKTMEKTDFVTSTINKLERESCRSCW